jgi:hypothetical protein
VNSTEEALSERGAALRRRRLMLLAPVVGFLGLTALFMLRLNSRCQASTRRCSEAR